MPDADLIDPTLDRVWAVEATVIYTTYVIAETADEAERIAEDEAGDLEPDFTARELTEPLEQSDGDRRIVPYGPVPLGVPRTDRQRGGRAGRQPPAGLRHRDPAHALRRRPAAALPAAVRGLPGGREGGAMRGLDLRQVRSIVTDANVLGRLNPAAVAAYLTRSGWVWAHERASGAVWTRWLDHSAVSVFLPNEPALADFALRMGTLLAALAVAEDRSQLAVLVDLNTASADHSVGAQPDSRTARRTDWMEPEYGLRRPELTLVLNLAACRIERQTFVRELRRLDWSRGQADELADLVCALLAARPAPASGKAPEATR